MLFYLMKLYTSYYAKSGKHPKAVGISGTAPPFYKGKRCTKLAPNWDLFNQWKATGDNDTYIKRFENEILNKLDPHKVLSELGDGAVLLCYETSDKFCHRHLVAKWLMQHTDVEISEI